MRTISACILLVFIHIGLIAQTTGCTDPLAENLNPNATQNDGSCSYPNTAVDTTNDILLPETLEETSGLILWNDLLWTHNDDADINLYGLDPQNGTVMQIVSLDGQVNTDWEEISQDADFIYVGDFGNNVRGNRTDLHILKISKQSILDNEITIERIDFAYEDQTDFTDQGGQNTDYDCEAMIVTEEFIFLFTKQWVSLGTAIYKLPKAAGTHQATLESQFDVDGLVTAATFNDDKELVVLSGYSNVLSPFVLCLYDYPSDQFLSGNKRKLSINLPQHQVEAITTENGLQYVISNERFGPLNIEAQLHQLDLTPYLGDFLNLQENSALQEFKVFPNPVNNQLNIKARLPFSDLKYFIVDSLGKEVQQGVLNNERDSVDLSRLVTGSYFISFDKSGKESFQILKK